LAGLADSLKDREARNATGSLQCQQTRRGDSGAVRWYPRYSPSLHDVEECFAERGLEVWKRITTTVWRWVKRGYGPELDPAAAPSS